MSKVNPTRTILVITRISKKKIVTTYLNNIDATKPYIMVVEAGVPVMEMDPNLGVGETQVVLDRWERNL